MKKPAFIFDLDGTLYQYKGGPTFATSSFYADIKSNIYSFFEANLDIPRSDIEREYRRLKQKYEGHTSLAVEKEFGIDRYTYFERTWNVSPEKYIEKNDDAHAVLSKLQGRAAILTEAPRVWAQAALEYLGAYDFVQDRLFTGEPDVRKPSVEALVQAGESLKVPFEQVYSVGDQEDSDIILAREAGMKTVRVGGDETSADFHIQSVRQLLNLGIVG